MTDDITLRDQFAMAAMQGIITRYLDPIDLVAACAYHYADAMLAERAKPPHEVMGGDDAEDFIQGEDPSNEPAPKGATKIEGSW